MAKRDTWHFTIILLLLLFTALYISQVSRTITYDEAYTFLEYAGSPITALFLYTTPNNHLLHSLFVWVSTSFIGDSTLAIRLPAFFAALLSVAYSYRIGRRLFDRRAGVIAAALLAVIPLFVDHAVTARGYSLSVLFALLFFEFVFFGFPFAQNSQHAVYLLPLVILLVITLPTMLLLIFPVVLWMMLELYKRRDYESARKYFVMVALGSVIGTFFYITGFLLDNLREFSDQFGFDDVEALVRGFFDRTMPLLLLPVIVIGVVTGLFYGWRQRRQFVETVGLILSVAVALAFLQQWVTGGVLFPRNYIYLLPFLALLVGLGWAALSIRLPYGNLITFSIVALMLFVAFDRIDTLGQPTQISELETAINQNIQANDALLTACCFDAPLQYIYRETPFMTIDETTSRVIVISTRYFSFEQIAAELEGNPACTPEQWAAFDVYVCPVTTPTAAPAR